MEISFSTPKKTDFGEKLPLVNSRCGPRNSSTLFSLARPRQSQAPVQVSPETQKETSEDIFAGGTFVYLSFNPHPSFNTIFVHPSRVDIAIEIACPYIYGKVMQKVKFWPQPEQKNSLANCITGQHYIAVDHHLANHQPVLFFQVG